MNFPQSDIYITAGNDKPNKSIWETSRLRTATRSDTPAITDDYQAQDLPYARYPSKPGRGLPSWDRGRR